MTIIVGVLFACTIDSLFAHPLPGILGICLVVLIILDCLFISRADMDKFFYDDKIKE